MLGVSVALAAPRALADEEEGDDGSEIVVDADGEEEAEQAEQAEEGAYDDVDEAREPPSIYDVSVFGDTQSVERVTAPAHRIGKEELERFEDDNIHRILPRVPGVYVRGEDGLGLRPNIGMRGANSDRSAKVNLLEDGILLGPAPYSAPAAYYFPVPTRMTGVEVFKGASSIRHGPNTIGGTINFLTRPIPYRHEVGLDLAVGSNFYGKAHGYYGYGGDNWGVLIEAVRLRSDGFKELDSAGSKLGNNTGFDKMEVMAKGRINTDPDDALYNEGLLKLTYSREQSNETYLGLTDADFADNPLRRYAASALGRMRWNRFGINLSHGLVYQDADDNMRTIFTLRTTAYRHDFSRAWRKLNAFGGSDALPIGDVLADPTTPRAAVFYDALMGGDSADLLIGTNDRTFVSQGLQSSAAWTLPSLGPWGNRLKLGARIHNDSIERLHTQDTYRNRAGIPELVGLPTETTTQNMGEAVAFAGYVNDEITLGPVLVSPGVRIEIIDTHFENQLNGEIIDGTQRVVLPGVGAVYKPVEMVSILGGVHMGFSPLTPGATAATPETAINYELGGRLATDWMSLEVTRFVSDYDNISGTCTFSSGCEDERIDTQFDGGEARITGVEAMVNLTVPTPIDLEIPIMLSYTFTRAQFLTSFESDNPQWGVVQAGYRMPYVPLHQAAGTVSFVSQEWGGLNFGAIYMDGMREVAGDTEPAPGQETDSFVIFDVTAQLKVLPEMMVYGKVENLLNNEYIVARRPFGARPGRPRVVHGGVKVLIR